MIRNLDIEFSAGSYREALNWATNALYLRFLVAVQEGEVTNPSTANWLIKQPEFAQANLAALYAQLRLEQHDSPESSQALSLLGQVIAFEYAADMRALYRSERIYLSLNAQ